MLPNHVKIVNMEVENGRAVIELTLPDWSSNLDKGYHEVYLWEAGALSLDQGVHLRLASKPAVSAHPAFYCAYPPGEDDACVIKIVQPHLWQGVEQPYLYQLQVYRVWEVLSGTLQKKSWERELINSQSVAIRSIQRIPEKGYFLNGRGFTPRCVYYDGIYDIYAKGSQMFWEGIMQKLSILAQMGANTLVLGSAGQMSEEERITLQKYCDRVGLLVDIRDSDNEISDTYVMGGELFDTPGLPTDAYYQCKSVWSKEPFVYISTEGLCRQPDGGYQLTIYSSCKKVTLMINDRVFGVQDGIGKVLFQDIQVKGFPVDITARTEECSMTVRCYGVHRKFS